MKHNVFHQRPRVEFISRIRSRLVPRFGCVVIFKEGEEMVNNEDASWAQAAAEGQITLPDPGTIRHLVERGGLRPVRGLPGFRACANAPAPNRRGR